MDVLGRATRWVRQPNLSEQVEREPIRVVAADRAVRPNRFPQLGPDGPNWRQATGRILKDESDLTAADPAHHLARRIERREIGARPVALRQRDPRGLLTARIRHELENGQSGHRLPAAALSNQTERFTRF